MAFIVEDDLRPFADIESEKAQQMIADATALAMLAAPCLSDSTLPPMRVDAVRAVLRAAILRWNEAGTGAMTQESVDDYSGTIDTRQPRRGMFWPSEIAQLQSICADGESGKAFAVDTLPVDSGVNLMLRPDLWLQWTQPYPPEFY